MWLICFIVQARFPTRNRKTRNRFRRPPLIPIRGQQAVFDKAEWSMFVFCFHPQGENKKPKRVQGASSLAGVGSARGFSPWFQVLRGLLTKYVFIVKMSCVHMRA
jgi:hypothetical protein